MMTTTCKLTSKTCSEVGKSFSHPKLYIERLNLLFSCIFGRSLSKWEGGGVSHRKMKSSKGLCFKGETGDGDYKGGTGPTIGDRIGPWSRNEDIKEVPR